ncbi:preprotein translocase subunit SecA [Pseudacidobacterium ailaaui]|uniref:preprotein translocase subunit SecA n=1 Tax=Pseudacidobacterium ailaaui TaxID=1382359 RepID=UPI00047DA56B|nr:preprotein translocase subunit SecA [Pseudacidobacterium ailaaui]MBX6361551.1 preprotein translocase subunit SecA [Pseudacidobacterium ailaaui]MCL6464978.1 preprotein translocase subunit SecA [Pseudacidobacterium ailaaui]
MIGSALTKIFGTSNERAVKRLMPVVQAINAMEPEIQRLSDGELRAKTDEFKARIAKAREGIADAEERKAAEKRALDEVLPEAFAVVREAGRRVLNMRHFDVQLIGGMVLHQGKIAEMKTGEGKTLVATLPCYLNALAGHGVHVVTVNDYLAKRDAEWMGKIYEFLGLTVGVIVHDLDDNQRRQAYAADITYGTNNEFGFDYLRDNMKFELADCVQRGHYFAIVDEVDSILIDEARTPLIISGPTDQTTDKYVRVDRIIPQLVQGEEIERGEEKILTGDYVVDEKHKTISVTDEGWEKIEKLLGIGNIADPENWEYKHHVETAIKAHSLYKRDVQYVVKDGPQGKEVIIVDEFTGRLMPGRRWSDGLHQAIEAKEGVNIRREDQTLATITFQNYFRLYQKLAGMTGTAETEAAEFDKIYKLEIVVIPTNKPMRRIEHPDVVYRTAKEKYFAVADEIARLHEKGQPVLVGTTSIEKSELLSQILQRKGVKHVVLNAKYHEREAEIVAQAGRLGMVTIATNMAGRGTDILLGGNAEFVAKQELVKKGMARAISVAEGALNPMAAPGMMRFYYQGQEFETSQENWDKTYAVHAARAQQEHDAVIAAGGLHIIGTERHESRRIDNQLRGRAGRQGDPGASRFYLSLEDDLMRIFAKEWVSTLLQRLGMEEGVPIESRMISKRIEAAQKAVEAQNFEARKHLLEYDDVMNKQREAVYGLRHQLLEGLDQKELILEDYVATILSNVLDEHTPEKIHPEQWDLKGLKEKLVSHFGLDLDAEGISLTELTRHEIGETIFERLKERYEAKEQVIGEKQMRFHERMIMLSVLDGLWKDHLYNMDHLKEGIGLRGYGQQDPLVAYKKESFDMFEGMMTRFQEDTVRFLFHMQIVGPDGRPLQIPSRPRPAIPAAPPVASAEAAQQHPSSAVAVAEPPAVPIPVRQPSTTIDEIEREFQRKKQRELEQARMAGSGDASAPAQRRTGEKVGRNDPCPCGSGKKYKKCHGANEG